MQKIFDKEFGEIDIRRNLRSRTIKISVTPAGNLRASIPTYAPVFLLQRFIKSSRQQLRLILSKQKPSYSFSDGITIGKIHRLRVINSNTTYVKRSGQSILLHLQPEQSLSDTAVEKIVRDEIVRALRVEAKAYLPNRLRYLASALGTSYKKVRFSHAGSRWGSYSSSGTVSLNIALMKLPFEIIDYVIIHELCHTKQMNHSIEFWNLVEAADPNYKSHRKQLKKHTPVI